MNAISTVDLPNNNHRSMFVLDDPSIEYEHKYKSIINNKNLRIGTNPRAKNVVITSIALLANVCWCEKLEWRVQASADGTYGLTKGKEILLIFGIFSVSMEGTRTLCPIAVCLAEGERLVATYLLLRNIQIACWNLFGVRVQIFRGG